MCQSTRFAKTFWRLGFSFDERETPCRFSPFLRVAVHPVAGSGLVSRSSIRMDPTRWIQEAVREGQAPVAAPKDVAEEPTAGYLTTDAESGIRIREATENDAPDLAAIAARAFHHAHFEFLDLSSLAGVAARFDPKTLKHEIREIGGKSVRVLILSRPVSAAG